MDEPRRWRLVAVCAMVIGVMWPRYDAYESPGIGDNISHGKLASGVSAVKASSFHVSLLR